MPAAAASSFSLKGDVTGGGSGVTGGVGRRCGRIEELAEDAARIPVSRHEELVRVLDPGRESDGTHRDAKASSFPFNASVALRPASSLSSARIDALHPLAIQEVEVVRREAVRAVERDRDGDADLVKRQRIEDGLRRAPPRRSSARPGSSRRREEGQEGSSGEVFSLRGRRGSSTAPVSGSGIGTTMQPPRSSLPSGVMTPSARSCVAQLARLSGSPSGASRLRSRS